MSWQRDSGKKFDWYTIFICVTLMFLGWLNIYAAVYDENHVSIFDISQKYGKQLIWIGAGGILAFFILLIDSKFFTTFAHIIYGAIIALLLCVLVLGKEVNGARAWFEIGSVRLQPAEFAKFATALSIAHIMSRYNFNINNIWNLIKIGAFLVLPMGLILMQNDTGSALVYIAFLIPMFREGLYSAIPMLIIFLAFFMIITFIYEPFTVLIVMGLAALLLYLYYYQNYKKAGLIVLNISITYGIIYGFSYLTSLNLSSYTTLIYSLAIFSIYALYAIYLKKLVATFWILLAMWFCIGATAMGDYVFDHLQPHQQDRINNLLGITSDLANTGYNVHQSKIAIGSGGFSGKGYLQGTQTKFNFVPEQSTDFIFCTVGEEWGFIGTTVVISLFILLLIRLILMAERQRSLFSRIYGYCVAGILFFHIAINIGMTIGLAPVIGIPLPFFSYGGSSLWAFIILIFIFIRFDADRLQVFS